MFNMWRLHLFSGTGFPWSINSAVKVLTLGLATFSIASSAPIRVVLFNSYGAGGYVHSISHQTPIIKELLLHPELADLQNPIIPAEGFSVDSVGKIENGDSADGHALILALPQHDVVVLVSNSAMDNLFTEADRKAFLDWARQKGHGLVALHLVIDDASQWPEKADYFGASLIGWRAESAQTLLDTSVGNGMDGNFLTLTAGLDQINPLNEEWMSFSKNPRLEPGIHVVSTVNEASYQPTFKMGDHPVSWYRAPVDSGRFFYTALGHFLTTFQDSYYFRRQLYNGILWASGYATPVTIASYSKAHSAEAVGAFIRSEALHAALSVTIARPGPHTLEVFTLEGKRIMLARAEGAQTHYVSHLNADSLYIVVVAIGNRVDSRIVKTD